MTTMTICKCLRQKIFLKQLIFHNFNIWQCLLCNIFNLGAFRLWIYDIYTCIP